MWLVFVVWLLLCVDFGIGLGVMGACGRLRSRGGWGFYGWWGFKSMSKILLGKMVDSSFRWLLLEYSE